MEEVSPSLSAQIERSAEQVARERLEEFKAQIERVSRSSEDSTQSNLERMRQETQAEILNAGIQARKIYKEESGTAAKVISVCVDSAVDSLNRAGDEAVSKLQAAYQTLELSLKKAAEERLPRLTDESASVLEKFRAETQALAAQSRSEVESTARQFSEKASGDISEKLEGAVEGALELVARDFNKQAGDSLELLKEGLRSAQQQCVDETQRQLVAARESTLASLESEAGVSLASFRERLRTTLLEMQAQQTKEIEKEIQTSLQAHLESLRAQVRLTADESAVRVTAEVRSRAEQALQELPDRLYKGVGMAVLVAKEWEEQAKTHLEAHLSHEVEVFQKQLEGLTMAAQERQRSDAEALKGLLQSRLHQAAQLFEGGEADAGQSKAVAREESRHSPSQSPRAARDPLRPDPLVEKQQRIIEEALSTFRSRLRQILADHAPKEPQGPAGSP
jgi:vacuolar-type H+-ATPase subunit E/Vma4